MSKATFCLMALVLVSSIAAKSVKLNLQRSEKTKAPSALKFLTNDTKNLSNEQNLAYYAELGFGRNSESNGLQMLPVQFDTGSSWLWSAQTGCDCPFLQGSNAATFSSSNISSFDNLGTPETLGYGRGGVQGTLATIDIYFTEDVVVKGQHFIVASETQDFGSSPFSGLVGLGRPVGSGGFNPLIFQMVENGLISGNVFTMTLLNSGRQSSITIGEVDQSIATAPFEYVPMVLEYPYTFYYTVVLPKMDLGNGNVITNHISIVDSGTSGLVIPGTPYNQYVNNALNNSQCSEFGEGEGIISCPCTNTGLSDITVTVGSNNFVIKGDDLVLPLEEGICQLALETANDAPGIVLGDTFMRLAVIVFDIENEKVGFAPN